MTKSINLSTLTGDIQKCQDARANLTKSCTANVDKLENEKRHIAMTAFQLIIVTVGAIVILEIWIKIRPKESGQLYSVCILFPFKILFFLDFDCTDYFQIVKLMIFSLISAAFWISLF